MAGIGLTDFPNRRKNHHAHDREAFAKIPIRSLDYVAVQRNPRFNLSSTPSPGHGSKRSTRLSRAGPRSPKARLAPAQEARVTPACPSAWFRTVRQALLLPGGVRHAEMWGWRSGTCVRYSRGRHDRAAGSTRTARAQAPEAPVIRMKDRGRNGTPGAGSWEFWRAAGAQASSVLLAACSAWGSKSNAHGLAFKLPAPLRRSAGSERSPSSRLNRTVYSHVPINI